MNVVSLQERKSLPDYVVFKPCPGTPLKDIFTAASDDLIDLLSSMLQLNPLKRCTATQVIVNRHILEAQYCVVFKILIGL